MNRPWITLLVVVVGLLSRPARADDTMPPSIIHEACSQYLRGKPFTIMARFEDDSKIFDPKVMYRSAADSHWKQAIFVKDPETGIFKATIKAKELKGNLQYFIEAFDEVGNGPARIGSFEAPIMVEASKSPDPCVQVPATGTLAATSGSPPIGVSVKPVVEPPPPPPPNATTPPAATPVPTATAAAHSGARWKLGVAGGGLALGIAGGALLGYEDRVAADKSSSGHAKEQAATLAWVGLGGLVVGVVTAGVLGWLGYADVRAP